MSLQCRPHMEPSGVPCIRPPMPPGQKRLRLPVMTVNGKEPDAKGNVVVDPPDLTELEGRIDGLTDAVDEENRRAAGAEEELGRRIAAEESRAQSVERGLRDDVSSAQTAIADRYTKRETDEKIAAATPSDYDAVKGRVAAVEAKVPAQASAQNQLADKAFVNSSIATDTATFRGTFNLVTDLQLPLDATREQVAAAVKARLGQADYDGSDYVFVQVPQDLEHTDAMKRVDRYKCVETGTNPVVKNWEYEWALNNSSFTAEQWAAINSGITSGLVAKLGALPTAEALAQALAGKASKADATLTPIYSDTPTFSEWTGTVVDAENIVVTGLPYYQPHDDEHEESYGWYLPTSHQNLHLGVYDKDAVSLSFNAQVDDWYLNYTATRTRTDILGYVLGSQADKPIASEAEAEALRTEVAGKASKSDVDPLLFAQYYPDGSVKSAAEFTVGIKYDDPDTTARTITVKPFCNTGTAANDNSALVGRVVIPPFVDSDGNPYISDDGTRFKVVGVSSGDFYTSNADLTAIIAPSTVTTIGDGAFNSCTSLASVSLPAATTIGDFAFGSCTSLASVDFGDTPRSSVPTLGANAFADIPEACKIIVPYTQYDAWIAADGWKDLPQEFVRHAEKADKPAAFTMGNLAEFDSQGNPVDSGVKPSDKLDTTSAAPAFSSDSSVSYPVDSHVTYNGKLYKCTTATTGGTWVAGSWAADTMTDQDAVLDITAQNQLRVVAKDGTLLWAQGYDLASTSSATLAFDAVNNFTFADGATTQAFTLPTAPTGKVGDFGLDIDNSANTGAATLTLPGLDSTFSAVVPEGESLNDMLAIAAGELSRFYISLSTFRVNNLPTWHIVKQVVENGGAQS